MKVACTVFKYVHHWPTFKSDHLHGHVNILLDEIYTLSFQIISQLNKCTSPQ